MNTKIKRIETMIKNYMETNRNTVFLLENVDTFTTEKIPIDYLIEHGTKTPKGRIVPYAHDTEGIDALSMSLYQFINESIWNGGLQGFGDSLEGDKE